MPRLTPSQITQAVQSVEQLIHGYERYIEGGIAGPLDPGFREYLNEQVAPTMSADERARYEGYLRTFFETRLGRSAEEAPTIRPANQADTEVSPTTATLYTKRAERLITRFEEDTGKRFTPDSEAFAAYMGERLAKVGRPSRRAYRAALDYHYRAALDRAEGAPDFRAWMPQTDDEVDPPKRQSRERGLPAADARALIEALNKKNTFQSRLAALTLESSILFGLRPSEWSKARLDRVTPDDADKPVGALVVENAKNTHGRAHSATRTLLFDGVDARQYAVVRETIRQWAAYIENFTAMNAESTNEVDTHQAIQAAINSAGIAVTKATRRLDIKPYTLYSARHQFAANAKAAGLSRVEVAALMGHASTETAGEHYGKRRRGSRGGLLVRPSPLDIAAVEARNNASIEQRIHQIERRSQHGEEPSMSSRI